MPICHSFSIFSRTADSTNCCRLRYNIGILWMIRSISCTIALVRHTAVHSCFFPFICGRFFHLSCFIENLSSAVLLIAFCIGQADKSLQRALRVFLSWHLLGQGWPARHKRKTHCVILIPLVDLVGFRRNSELPAATIVEVPMFVVLHFLAAGGTSHLEGPH
jgi:hypothetical protein